MVVLHLEMKTHLFSWSSLDLFSLSVTQLSFCLFICQSNICYGMAMTERYRRGSAVQSVLFFKIGNTWEKETKHACRSCVALESRLQHLFITCPKKKCPLLYTISYALDH